MRSIQEGQHIACVHVCMLHDGKYALVKCYYSAAGAIKGMERSLPATLLPWKVVVGGNWEMRGLNGLIVVASLIVTVCY